MGVHGLWELLAPVGRRVSVETLAGKKLAIGNHQFLTLTILISLTNDLRFVFVYLQMQVFGWFSS